MESVSVSAQPTIGPLHDMNKIVEWLIEYVGKENVDWFRTGNYSFKIRKECVPIFILKWN